MNSPRWGGRVGQKGGVEARRITHSTEHVYLAIQHRSSMPDPGIWDIASTRKFLISPIGEIDHVNCVWHGLSRFDLTAHQSASCQSPSSREQMTSHTRRRCIPCYPQQRRYAMTSVKQGRRSCSKFRLPSCRVKEMDRED